jgi:hypothetical protein
VLRSSTFSAWIRDTRARSSRCPRERLVDSIDLGRSLGFEGLDASAELIDLVLAIVAVGPRDREVGRLEIDRLAQPATLRAGLLEAASKADDLGSELAFAFGHRSARPACGAQGRLESFGPGLGFRTGGVGRGDGVAEPVPLQGELVDFESEGVGLLFGLGARRAAREGAFLLLDGAGEVARRGLELGDAGLARLELLAQGADVDARRSDRRRWRDPGAGAYDDGRRFELRDLIGALDEGGLAAEGRGTGMDFLPSPVDARAALPAPGTRGSQPLQASRPPRGPGRRRARERARKAQPLPDSAGSAPSRWERGARRRVARAFGASTFERAGLLPRSGRRRRSPSCARIPALPR